MHQALIVEDNADLANLIRIHMEDAGFEALIANDGQAAVESFEQGVFQLVLLDVMLPRMNGLDVCKNIRSRDESVPILMLTAKGEEIDRVVGLEVGADDYLVKPFGVAELTARVKALMRRSRLLTDAVANADKEGVSSGADGGSLVHGDIELDVTSREVRIDGKPVQLTLREFELLHFMMAHPAEVFSREQLLKQVWGYNNGVYQHTVNSHINRLRAKIEKDAHHPAVILTVWGVGYKLGDSLNHAQQTSA